VGFTQGADFPMELRKAFATLENHLEVIQDQINEGRFTEANERLLAVFPKETRTPAQAMVLGNMLYSVDTNLSYGLHKEVAGQLPSEPLVLLEWAMEQHRAGEHAGALAAYDAYSKQHPQFAPVHGLAADCLIRLGRTREAASRWKESENATEGTLVKLESLVCEIYKDPSLNQRRALLRAKAEKGDVDAAVRLIALDGRFEHDWWNEGPHHTYLLHDLPLLKAFPEDTRISAAQCLAECLLIEDPDADQIRAILDRHGLLIDRDKTLPSDPPLLSLLLGVAIRNEVLSRDESRLRFGQMLLADALRTKDADLFNILAFLEIGTERMASVEKQAWAATGQARFAAGYLVEELRRGTLQPTDALLINAMNQFPEDSVIMFVGTSMTDPPTEELLVQAIKAEYRRFSSIIGLIPRPSAKLLRVYFAKLDKIVN
jgi:hypothetical protein